MNNKLTFVLIALFILLPRAYAGGEVKFSQTLKKHLRLSPKDSDRYQKFEAFLKTVDSALSETVSESSQKLQKALSDRFNALAEPKKESIDSEEDDDSDTDEELEENYKKLFEKIKTSLDENELKKNLCDLIVTDTVNFPTSLRGLDKLTKTLGCKADSLKTIKPKSRMEKEFYLPMSSYQSTLPRFWGSSYGQSSKSSYKPSLVGGNVSFRLDDEGFDNDGPFAKYMKEQAQGRKAPSKTNALSALRPPLE